MWLGFPIYPSEFIDQNLSSAKLLIEVCGEGTIELPLLMTLMTYLPARFFLKAMTTNYQSFKKLLKASQMMHGAVNS